MWLCANVWAYFYRFFLTLFGSAERSWQVKVEGTIHKCFKCRNAIMLECWKLKKIMLAIIKKWKNGCHIMETHCTAKFPITDTPSQSLGLCFSECWWKWKMGINHYAKIEKWLPHHRNLLYSKLPTTNPPKFGSPVFLMSTEMENGWQPL